MIKVGGLYYPDGETYLQRHIADKGVIEVAGKPTYQFGKLKKAIPYIANFRHAVDVGANIGTWARVLARLFTRVTAFEPVAAFADCIPANLNEGDNVEVHRCALGSAVGEVSVLVEPRSSAFTHVKPTHDSPGVNERHRGHLGGELKHESINVHVRTLDSFGLPKVDFLKIDVEGFEQFVVEGASNTILRDRPVIIVEQKPGTADRYGLGRRGAVALLEKWGAKVMFSQSSDFCMRWE